MTEKELIKRFWWRKETKSRTYDLRTGTTTFADSIKSLSSPRRKEISTWRYELAKRHARDAGLPPIRKAGSCWVRELEDPEPGHASTNWECLPQGKRNRGPKGRHNRPVSWRWVEVLDYEYYLPGHKFSMKDQRMLRKAKRYAKECFEWLQNVQE